MKKRFIKLTNGKTYFVHGTFVTVDPDFIPSDYVSWVDREEIIDGYHFTIPNAYLGFIINGVYSGVTGTFSDINGNRYTVLPQSGGVYLACNSVTGTVTGDRLIVFGCDNENFGLAAIPLGADGTILTLYQDSIAYGSTHNGSSFGDWVSAYLDRPNYNLNLYKDDYIECYRLSAPGLLYTYAGISIYYEGGLSTIYEDLDDINLDRSIEDEDDDPYADDDESSEGGGSDNQDNWDDSSDDNGVPDLPTISATDTGFITLYNPTVAQLQSLAQYMWGSLFDIDTWKKVMADPMDAIIGLSIVPVSVAGGARTVTVGNISTGISLNRATAQFVEVDCGTIAIDEKWHCYLDYSPYTKVSIYLPYIGFQELDIDLIQGTTLGVVYHVDVLSGACVAYITEDSRVVAEFSGQCSISIPVTSQDFTQTIMALGGLVASGIGVVATGGLSAPVDGAAIAGLATAAANTAANVASSKPTFAKSGNMSGSNGLMGHQIPYLIIETPNKCAPARQNSYVGYPSYITKQLSTLSGFTQMQDIRLDVACTDVERDEILDKLRKGVIL